MQPKDNFNAKVLRRIKEYKDADPNWDKAIKKVVDAEVIYGKTDPTEGKAVIQRVKSPKRSK
jgi:hypothetical protein